MWHSLLWRTKITNDCYNQQIEDVMQKAKHWYMNKLF
jgi:hypothetical protein